jgi:hypothetical protein
MNNIIYVNSPFFEKHLGYLIEERFSNKVKVISGTSEDTIENIVKHTKKSKLSKKKCSILLIHSDGSKNRNVKNIATKIKSKIKDKQWTGSNNKDITAIPTIVRRTLYNVNNIIGNKSVLSNLLSGKDYLPKTETVKYDSKIKINLRLIWIRNKFGKKNPVILKPSIGQEQKGIGVCYTITQAYIHIGKVLKKYPNYINWEIQKYIYKPLCIKGDILFPGLKINTTIPLKDSKGETRILKKNKFYKCHIRAFGLIVYFKTTKIYKIYLYNKYKFNSAREPYPDDLLNDKIDSVDFSNPWSHKSGGSEGGAMPFDFNELIEYLERNNIKDKMRPKIKTNDMINIKEQINVIIKDMMKVTIRKGKCCTPTNDSIDTALAIYNPLGIDLLIDDKKKVWLIEANPGVGFSLIPNNIISIYNNQNNILSNLNGTNNFNARLYYFLRLVSKKDLMKDISAFGGLKNKYFDLYNILMKMDKKYQDIDNLTDIGFKNLEKKIYKDFGKKIVLKPELFRNSKIFINIGKDYLEYIKNCRFFWRHNFIDRVLRVTLDKLIKNDYKFQKNIGDFELILRM